MPRDRSIVPTISDRLLQMRQRAALLRQHFEALAETNDDHGADECDRDAFRGCEDVANDLYDDVCAVETVVNAEVGNCDAPDPERKS